MYRALLVTAVLVLTACAETRPVAPRRQAPAPVVVSPRIEEPLEPQPLPAVEPPRRAPSRVLSDEVHPAVDPAAESSRIARAVDGVAIAASRTGRHRLRMIGAVQRVTPADVTLQFSAVLEPSTLDVVMGGVLPVRRFVTTDGWELASPEQEWNVDAVQGIVSSLGIDLARRHRGLRNLDLDARIFEIRQRETFERGPYSPGEHETMLGPFPVKVVVEDQAVTVDTWTDRAAERAWNARHAQPLIRALDVDWVLASIQVRDGRGRVLALVSVGDGGGGATGRFVADLKSYGAPEAPITVSLAVPASYMREDTSFYFQDLPLTTVEGQ